MDQFISLASEHLLAVSHSSAPLGQNDSALAKSSSEPSMAGASIDLRSSAIAFAEAGFAVFPMHTPDPISGSCSCRNPTCSDAGKHPRTRTGFKAASTDLAQVKKWWSGAVDKNIGIATGEQSDLLVIDVDYGSGGRESLELLSAESGTPWPDTRTVITGNGAHYWFKMPARAVRSTSSVVAPGIDVRAEGGCVVAPPSLHRSGKRYRFVDSEAEILQIPEWLLDRITTQSSIPRLRSESASLVQVGSRNTHLLSVGGRLRRSGADEEFIANALWRENLQLKPPLAFEEVQKIAHSVAQYRCEKVEESDTGKGHSTLWWFTLDTRWWNENLSIAQMSAEQLGWYMRLLVRAWPQQGRLPADLNVLARLAQAECKERFTDGLELLLQDFEPLEVEGRPYLVHRMLEELYVRGLSVWEQKRKAGVESGRKRKEDAERRRLAGELSAEE